jgi:hypothetical protein
MAVWVGYEFGGDAFVEFRVTLPRILKTNGFGINDFRDRQPVVRRCHHELPIVA